MDAVLAYPRNTVTLEAYEYEEISLGAASTALNATKLAPAWHVVIKVDGGANARYRVDGGVPTAAIGVPLYDGEQVQLSKEEATAFRAIRMDAVNPVLRATFYRARIQ